MESRQQHTHTHTYDRIVIKDTCLNKVFSITEQLTVCVTQDVSESEKVEQTNCQIMTQAFFR